MRPKKKVSRNYGKVRAVRTAPFSVVAKIVKAGQAALAQVATPASPSSTSLSHLVTLHLPTLLSASPHLAPSIRICYSEAKARSSIGRSGYLKNPTRRSSRPRLANHQTLPSALRIRLQSTAISPSLALRSLCVCVCVRVVLQPARPIIVILGGQKKILHRLTFPTKRMRTMAKEFPIFAPLIYSSFDNDSGIPANTAGFGSLLRGRRGSNCRFLCLLLSTLAKTNKILIGLNPPQHGHEQDWLRDLTNGGN
ncbi:uncharacterized protein CLUP02_16682 [Colletotrichum lupini]|uniref:Uncharacterized protein n=1 Tax=Colletotrichum lupini TaxID=145971 RepID=A0A9Q8WPF5_9PEZI|nr:uncharacterized protein CLUP02_16682 [Colletotrichum lupini]UQC91148.1 hypothetical protein CLUP02_16682 [Colletotrichum lupini]